MHRCARSACATRWKETAPFSLVHAGNLCRWLLQGGGRRGERSNEQDGARNADSSVWRYRCAICSHIRESFPPCRSILACDSHGHMEALCSAVVPKAIVQASLPPCALDESPFRTCCTFQGHCRRRCGGHVRIVCCACAIDYSVPFFSFFFFFLCSFVISFFPRCY